jgi:hypothetical protein
MKLWFWMLRMCVYMHSCFVENHPIWILEDVPLISDVVLSQALSPVWLSIYIVSRLSQPGSAVASMSQCHHRQQDSATLSLVGLGVYIAPWPSYLGSTVTSRTRQCRLQHDSTAPSPARLGIDITQLLDHQHQQYMTLGASRHVASSYLYYSPLCLVLGPMQASRWAAWHLCEESTFWRLVFEDFKL